MGLFDLLWQASGRLRPSSWKATGRLRIAREDGRQRPDASWKASRRAPAAPVIGNPLAGKPLRYLIGADGTHFAGGADVVTEVPYGVKPARLGISIAYCNLFDENNTGAYGPYCTATDTAELYGEGVPDPEGPGFFKNLREQFARAKSQGFDYVELDNPDAYRVSDVIRAIDLAAGYRLKVIAKNPELVDDDATPYLAHRNVFGVIVEKGAGTPAEMHRLRSAAGKPELPVWFVAFGEGRAGDGKSWAMAVGKAAASYQNMRVTYSSVGEYGNSIDIL